MLRFMGSQRVGWGQEDKGTTEDEMAGWHHRLNGHGFGWTPGVGDGQGGLACGHKLGGCCRSVTMSCTTLCDPMDCSTPGLPVHYQLLESTQTHVH